MSPFGRGHARSSRDARGRARSRRRRGPALAATGVATVLVLAAWACGGSSSSDASSSAAAGQSSGGSLNTSVDPCSLLTTDQVSQALGVKVSDGQGENAKLSDSRTCTWNTPKFGSAYNCATDVVSVVLEVVSPPDALKQRFHTAASYYDFELQTQKQAYGASGATIEEVPGIGDGAFAVTLATKKGLDLYARKGDVLLRVFSVCGVPATLEPQLEELMKQAVAKT